VPVEAGRAGHHGREEGRAIEMKKTKDTNKE
jgi:hypothetical protein